MRAAADIYEPGPREVRAAELREERDRLASYPDDEEIDATLAKTNGTVCVRLGRSTGISELTREDARRLAGRIEHLLTLAEGT